VPEDLNRTLALAKQALEELVGLASLDELSREHFGEGSKRDRIAELLKKLNTQIVTIRRTLSAVVADGSSPPVLTLPPGHRVFWNDVLAPKASLLQRAYFQISDLGILADLVDYPSPNDEPSFSKLSAVSWALERWSDNMLDEDELYEWLDRGFDIEGAQEIVSMPWFRPDEWSKNLGLLQPVLVDRPTAVMRDHVRYRLLEIYRAFSFGLWMSAIALSRSLVEFSLRSNAPRFSVSMSFEGADGRQEEKSLKRLGEEMSVLVPALAKPVEVVRETGNRILHPKKHDVIAHPKVMRSEALECIHAARAVVEAAYSELPQR
jgi:hypothetical protein